MEYEEHEGLFEINTKLHEVPCKPVSRDILRGLIEDYGTDGTLWEQNTVEVIDRIIDVVGHIVADAKTFEYKLDEDFTDVLSGIKWIRSHLGYLLP